MKNGDPYGYLKIIKTTICVGKIRVMTTCNIWKMVTEDNLWLNDQKVFVRPGNIDKSELKIPIEAIKDFVSSSWIRVLS